MNYMDMVEVAGKSAGKYVFDSIGVSNVLDPDLSIAVDLLKEAFPKYSKDVIEGDILWCQEQEFERLVRESK